MHVSLQDGEFLRRQLGLLLDTATHQDLDLHQPHRTPGGSVADRVLRGRGEKRSCSPTEVSITSVISGVHLL